MLQCNVNSKTALILMRKIIAEKFVDLELVGEPMKTHELKYWMLIPWAQRQYEQI